MADALYGPAGFYRRGEAPRSHFRTSVHATPRFAAAVLVLLHRVDAALGRPRRIDLVDVGAGRGELLGAIAATVEPDLDDRLRLTAVDLAPRPADLPAQVTWTDRIPELTGLLIANEWLDDVPVDVVEHTTRGLRRILVTPAGAESLGPAPPQEDLDWVARWWPTLPGQRAEIGRLRDAAWAKAIRAIRQGAAIAIDYAHGRDTRPAGGTLTGHRAGRVVPPTPDGSCNLTAHVALDACASAGETAGATATLLTTQREALHALGVTGRRPPPELAHTDPARYVRALAGASESAELTDPAGLGAFHWLIQGVGVPLPLR
jgi:SAM-dependent MidA family methyltransferase